MKKITLITFLAISTFSFAQKEKNVTSSIREVNVYLNRAQINRTAKTQVAVGNTNIILTGLTSKIDANSIQVNGKGNFILMGVKHQMEYLNKNKASEKAQLIQSQIDGLLLSNKKLEQKKTVLKEEKELIKKNRTIGSQQKGVTSEELAKMTSFFRTKRTEIDNLYLEYDEKTKKNTQKKFDLQNELSQINRNANKPSSSIVVSISSKIAQSITLNFDYMVYNAGWNPYYDIRAKEGNKKVQLSYKAKIYQNTNIDWENVLVNVSTGNPAQGGSMPNLNLWYLSLYTPYSLQKKSKTYAPQMEEVDDWEEEDLDWGNDDDVEVVAYKTPLIGREGKATISSDYTSVSESNLATTFKIALKQSIPSDNKKHTVDIQQYDITSSFTHAAVPKLDKDAFLLAQLTDWEDYNLLSGNANVFYNGSFVGKTYIDMKNTSDSLDVSLGRDSKVIITREKIKDYSKTKTIGTNLKKSVGYEITVRNTKKQAINLIVEDQLPISKTSEIEVNVVEKSGGKINKNTQKVTWNLKLEPGETKTIQLKFEVKYPKKKSISGL